MDPSLSIFVLHLVKFFHFFEQFLVLQSSHLLTSDAHVGICAGYPSHRNVVNIVETKFCLVNFEFNWLQVVKKAGVNFLPYEGVLVLLVQNVVLDFFKDNVQNKVF